MLKAIINYNNDDECNLLRKIFLFLQQLNNYSDNADPCSNIS